MEITFWGVRGSIACPGPEYAKYGGNTSCIEISCGNTLLILDAGTGLRQLGKKLSQLKSNVTAHMLLSHTHYDHISGLPFFEPLYSANNKFTLYAGHLAEGESLKGVLSHMMQEPLFPVPLDIFDAQMYYQNFKSGESFQIDEVKIKTIPLNHPNGACAYRITYGGKSVCYVTDTEHIEGELDQSIVGLIADTDLFVYDSTFSEKDYESHKGWGHSTWEAGYALAKAAGVKKYILFHHSPDYDDKVLDKLAQNIQKWDIAAEIATEKRVIKI